MLPEFPRRRVRVLVLRAVTDVPALVAIGMWFVFQVVMGMFDTTGGVAYGAHIGGFIAGVLLVKPLSGPRALRARARGPAW